MSLTLYNNNMGLHSEDCSNKWYLELWVLIVGNEKKYFSLGVTKKHYRFLLFTDICVHSEQRIPAFKVETQYLLHKKTSLF